MEKKNFKNLNNTLKKPFNNKWDKLLYDYENYTKEYIKQYKKSLNNNLNSLSKYPYMKAKTELLLLKLSEAQNKDLLTEKQVKRIAKIQMKMIIACET